MLGILLIDKPLGLTSHDVVNRLRRKFGTKRIGHAGTLDPLATGLLVVAVGPATRFLQYLPLEPKEYVGDFKFGVETTTQDAEGEVVADKPVPSNLMERIRKESPKLVGLINQVPPMYSAVKVAGQPLYAYARAGKSVERRSRTVHIECLETLDERGNEIEFRVVCSGGTYMRTLCHDLGQLIGCGAHLSALRRTRAGRFDIADAVPLEDTSPEHLIPLSEAIKPMPVITLNAIQEASIRQGQRIGYECEPGLRLVALANAAGVVLGVASVHGPMLQPDCVLPIEVDHG